MPTWTPGALSREARPLKGECWRLVEAQHRVSTLKLVDTLAEQALIEELLEETKPPLPPECRHLHYLLATPFRYGPYPGGSRYRRPGHTPGVFYASEHVETAVAEIAFHRLLFFAESPDTPWPENAAEFTGFSVAYATALGLDLTLPPPLLPDRALWTDLVDYGPCQALAENARAAGIQALRSESVRDPGSRASIALLTCLAFAATEPSVRQTWRLRFGEGGVQALCEFPELRCEFPHSVFAADPRMAALRGNR